MASRAPDATEPGALDTEATVSLPRVPPRPRGRRIVLICTVLFLATLGILAGTAFVASETLGSNIGRVPGVFVPLDGTVRPPQDDALTFLLVGTDTLAEGSTTGSQAQVEPTGRSDVVMIARVDPARTGASVVSIPRDSWVEIPGRGPEKINAAYAVGGPSLLVQTVESLTGLRVDHFGVVDFAGFQRIVDAVGGIDVGITEATSHDGVEFRQGVNHLDGGQALAYVRQRAGLPGGDLDRGQRQQNALREVIAKAASGGLLADPLRTYEFLDALTRAVSVDDTLTNGRLRTLSFEMSGLRPGAVTFLRAPVAGFGQEGAQAVVHLDDKRGAELWTALRDDRGADYADRHPDDALGTVTR